MSGILNRLILPGIYSPLLLIFIKGIGSNHIPDSSRLFPVSIQITFPSTDRSPAMDVKLKVVATTPEPDLVTSSYSSIAALVFLTVNIIASLVRSRHDLPMAAFIISVYLILMLLFWCLHVVEKMPENSSKREQFKLPVWALATTLNFLFAYRVSALLPVALVWVVWVLAGSCCAATFYVLLVHEDKSSTKIKACSFEPLPVAEV